MEVSLQNRRTAGEGERGGGKEEKERQERQKEKKKSISLDQGRLEEGGRDILLPHHLLEQKGKLSRNSKGNALQVMWPSLGKEREQKNTEIVLAQEVDS